MTNTKDTIKNEVVKKIKRTRGVKDVEFISDDKLKVVISNRNTDLITEVQKAYIDLKINGLVDDYVEDYFPTEAIITINEYVCEDPKFTDGEKAHFGLDVLEYAFYKKELEGLEGANYEIFKEDVANPTGLLYIIKNDIYAKFDKYPIARNIAINFTIESLLKNYYYYNGTYDLFTTYKTDFFKKENENVDEYLKYASEIIKDTTNEKGEIKHKEKANLVIVVLAVALARVLRENNMSIFEKFTELI